MSDAMLARLRAVPMLATIPDSEIRCLGDARELQIPAGEFIARQNEAAHFFWILLSGEVRIFQAQPDGSESTLAMIPTGTAMGEMQLLSNTPYAASAQAVEP